jgi:formate dehydrogenase iron-sulfur subunit
VYGESELDGLHQIYVLDDSPEAYGLPKDPQIPPATSLWQDILHPLGYAALGLTAVGLVFNYGVARTRIKREKEQKRHAD